VNQNLEYLLKEEPISVNASRWITKHMLLILSNPATATQGPIPNIPSDVCPNDASHCKTILQL